MTRRRSFYFRQFVLIAMMAAFFAGCDAKKAETQTPASPTLTPSPSVTTDVVAKLVKADAVDGKIDKIVSKCGGCSLGMDGKSDIALNVGEYKMYFCNPGCKEGFEKDPGKAVLAMAIPN